ncbi:MAG: EpsG family protein, partial [Anaeroplasmataceae bacterium]|nr:EpsG family protein [Anaeroplasmataceae bacterium]
MIVYITAFIVTLLFSTGFIKFRESYKNSKFSRTIDYKIYSAFLFLMAVFPLWFITAFRYDVGTDYLYTYVKYFEHTSYGWKPYRHEPLFQLLNTVLVSLNLSYVWLFAISGMLILGFLFYYIFKFSPKPLYSIVIFFCSSFFFNSLNNVRQYIAIAIAIIGFSQKNTIKAFIIILIATLFHLTAIVYIPLYIVMNLMFAKPVKKSKMIKLSILSIVLAPALCFILKKIIVLTPYAYFLDSQNGGYSLLIIIVNIIIFIFTLFYYDSKDKIYQKFAFLQLLTALCCVCSVFLQNEEMWMRIIRITSTFQIILLPKIILKEKNHLSRYAVGLIFIAIYSVYTLYT